MIFNWSGLSAKLIDLPILKNDKSKQDATSDRPTCVFEYIAYVAHCDVAIVVTAAVLCSMLSLIGITLCYYS